MPLRGLGNKIYKKLQSAKQRKAPFVTMRQETVTPQAIQSWNLYQFAKSTPVSVFFNCQCDPENKGQYLVLEGEPPAEEVNKAWLNIYSEYCTIAGGSSLNAMLSKVKAEVLLASKLERVRAMMELAAQHRHEGLCKAISAEGYPLIFGADDNTYSRQIAMAVARMKMESLHLATIQKDIEEDKDNKEDKPPVPADFIAVLQTISKHETYRVTDSISVLEYAMFLKRLKDSIKQQKAAQDAQR